MSGKQMHAKIANEVGMLPTTRRSSVKNAPGTKFRLKRDRHGVKRATIRAHLAGATQRVVPRTKVNVSHADLDTTATAVALEPSVLSFATTVVRAAYAVLLHMHKTCVSAWVARVTVHMCAAAVNLALLHPVRAWSRVLRVGLNSGKTRMAPYNAKVQLAVTQCNGKRCRSQLLLIDIAKIIATAQ